MGHQTEKSRIADTESGLCCLQRRFFAAR